MKPLSTRARWVLYALALSATGLAIRGIGGAEENLGVVAPARPVERAAAATA